MSLLNEVARTVPNRVYSARFISNFLLKTTSSEEVFFSSTPILR
jgi:hypothetical protein